MDKSSSRTGWGILGVPQGSCLGSREGDWPSLHEATLLLLVLYSPFLCPTKVVTSDSTQGWRVIPTEVLGETPLPVEYTRFPVPPPLPFSASTMHILAVPRPFVLFPSTHGHGHAGGSF